MLDEVHPEEILSSTWDNRPRKLLAHICESCQVRFFAPRHTDSKFCSSACARKVSERKVKQVCAQCGDAFERTPSHSKSKSGMSFCRRKCKDTAQRLEGIKAIHPPHYGRDIVHRGRLIRGRGHRCEICRRITWRGKAIPLEVDHINGDPFDHKSKNLRLVCRNCHAQTPTYGWRNMGRGRKSRKDAKKMKTTGM